MKVRERGNLHHAALCAFCFDGKSGLLFDAEILEACHSSIPHIGDILVSVFFPVLSGLREIGVGLKQFLWMRVIVASGFMVFRPQVAGDARFIFPFAAQGAAVQAAGGDLRLLEPAVRRPLQLLGAGLAGIGGAVRLSVIKIYQSSPIFSRPPWVLPR